MVLDLLRMTFDLLRMTSDLSPPQGGFQTANPPGKGRRAAGGDPTPAVQRNGEFCPAQM